MTLEFYYGTTWKWPIPYLPRVMLSAGFARNLKKPYIIDKPWMMDSGIGGMFKEGSRPRLTIEEYSEIIKKWNPPIAWTYDFPCEPSIRERFHYDPTQAQIKTNESTTYLRDNFGMENVMSVVQGWSISDYQKNIDLIKEQGLLTEHLGIGSICRRGRSKEIERIVKTVHNSVPRWVKLHGFGAKTSILQGESKFFLHSVDSSAWGMDRRYYSWTKNNNKGLTWHDKVPHLLDYITKMETLISISDPFTMMEIEE
ncbi:MAG: deazapurine DNA modification protein DpdA family protein [Thermoplasmataceae archaeon]